MRRSVLTFLCDESGATSIEYAVIACGLSIVIISAVDGIGATLANKFAAVSTALK